MTEPISLVVAAAGMISGSIFGVTLPTETERKIRRSNHWRLFSNGHWLGMILNAVLPVLILGVLMAVVSVGILEIGGAYPLSQQDRYVLSASLLLGAGLAKWLRYLYWSCNA
jgi:hypothetical protein